MRAAAGHAHARAKPAARPKKQPKAAAAADDAADGDDAPDAKLKPKRRRSAPPKKKETDSDDGGRVLTQRALEDPRVYERAPRLLPDIAGVRALSATEANADVRGIQSALGAFEAKVAALLPPPAAGLARAADDDDDAGDDAPLGLKHPRRVRLTAEEVVESLPACRRAVRITQRELAAMTRERSDLERDFTRMRCAYVAQVSAMKQMQKQQQRLARVLGRDVVRIAKSLESSRRRTNALQDIMTELEARGSSVVRLTREKRQLEVLLAKHSVALPEIDEVYVGDRVKYAAGVGRVLALDADTRILSLETDDGGRASVHEDDADVLPVEISYVDAERELKQSFFEKIGALVQPNGVLGAPTTARRQRGAASDDDESDDDDDDDDDDDESDDNDDDESDVEAKKTDSDAEQGKPKKRKLTLMPTPGAARKKRPKHVRVIEFPASTIPSTPFDVGLLLSPLSTLPDRVAAVGPSALQWKNTHLPSRMSEWEQERYDALQMKGELERLRFQLQKSEAEKLDAQQHATDQLESINQLVTQLDKLRESVSMSGSGSASSAGACPHCSASNGTRKSSAAATTGKAASKAKPAGKKDEAHKRQHGESGDGNGPEEEAEKLEKLEKEGDGRETESGAKRSLQDAGDDDDDAAGESSDGASSKPATRSLRPRRKPTSNSTTASPKQSK